MTDKEELRNLADRCKMWASHPVPFAGSFGDVVADGATVKDWGAVPELTTPSAIAPKQFPDGMTAEDDRRFNERWGPGGSSNDTTSKQP